MASAMEVYVYGQLDSLVHAQDDAIGCPGEIYGFGRHSLLHFRRDGLLRGRGHVSAVCGAALRDAGLDCCVGHGACDGRVMD